MNSLGLMVVISSIIGLIYSFLFLPIIFTVVKIGKPHAHSERFSRFFSEKIKDYNPLLLKIFTAITVLLFVLSLYKLYTGLYHVKSEYSSKIIKLSLEQNEINIDSMRELEQVTELLSIDEVEKIVSPYQAIKSLYNKESEEGFNLEDIELDRYIFMLDMFGGYDELFSSGRVKIDIYLKENIDKAHILNLIQKSGVELYIRDIDSLLQSAKIETINIMVGLVFLMIFVISGVVYLMTRVVSYALLGVVVTLVPIVWFFSLVTTFGFSISTEMFVAMIIAVAISSDATIHLFHYYYILESENRFDKDGLKKLFMYVESPLIFGNIILSITFFLMMIANISSIMFIGIFSAIIVLFSLFTDILILPVMILENRKLQNNRGED
jgi:predicted RND superfamily exporter protein